MHDQVNRVRCSHWVNRRYFQAAVKVLGEEGIEQKNLERKGMAVSPQN